MNHILAIPRASRLLAGALCLLCGSSGSCVSPTTTEPGAQGPRQVSSLPDFSLTTLTGESVRSQDYEHKVLVVNFWATWCQPCVYEIPHLNDLYTEFQSKGVEILGISMDSADPESVRRFTQRHRMKYPVVVGAPRSETISEGSGPFQPPSSWTSRERSSNGTTVIGLPI